MCLILVKVMCGFVLCFCSKCNLKSLCASYKCSLVLFAPYLCCCCILRRWQNPWIRRLGFLYSYGLLYHFILMIILSACQRKLLQLAFIFQAVFDGTFVTHHHITLNTFSVPQILYKMTKVYLDSIFQRMLKLMQIFCSCLRFRGLHRFNPRPPGVCPQTLPKAIHQLPCCALTSLWGRTEKKMRLFPEAIQRVEQHKAPLRCSNKAERIMSFLMPPVTECNVPDETWDFTASFFHNSIWWLVKSNCVSHALEALWRKPLLSLQSLDSTLLPIPAEC